MAQATIVGGGSMGFISLIQSKTLAYTLINLRNFC